MLAFMGNSPGTKNMLRLYAIIKSIHKDFMSISLMYLHRGLIDWGIWQTHFLLVY